MGNQVLYPHIQNYAYGDPVRIWESPYAYGQGSLNYSHMGIPVRITKLCAYWEQHIRKINGVLWCAIHTLGDQDTMFVACDSILVCVFI